MKPERQQIFSARANYTHEKSREGLSPPTRMSIPRHALCSSRRANLAKCKSAKPKPPTRSLF